MKETQTEIKICMGSSCFARGNAQNLEHIENFIKENNISAKVELVGSRCENKCAEGPNIFINGELFSKVDEEKLQEILGRLITK